MEIYCVVLRLYAEVYGKSSFFAKAVFLMYLYTVLVFPFWFSPIVREGNVIYKVLYHDVIMIVFSRFIDRDIHNWFLIVRNCGLRMLRFYLRSMNKSNFWSFVVGNVVRRVGRVGVLLLLLLLLLCIYILVGCIGVSVSVNGGYKICVGIVRLFACWLNVCLVIGLIGGN